MLDGLVFVGRSQPRLGKPSGRLTGYSYLTR